MTSISRLLVLLLVVFISGSASAQVWGTATLTDDGDEFFLRASQTVPPAEPHPFLAASIDGGTYFWLTGGEWTTNGTVRTYTTVNYPFSDALAGVTVDVFSTCGGEGGQINLPGALANPAFGPSTPPTPTPEMISRNSRSDSRKDRSFPGPFQRRVR